MKGHNDPHCLKCVAWNFPHHKKSWKGLSSEWERNLNYPPPSGGCSYQTWWIIRQTPCEGIFELDVCHWTVRTGHLFLRRGSNRVLLRAPSSISPPHNTVPHLACEPLKRKPAARGTRAPPELSIDGWSCRQPSLGFVVGSVAPIVCPRARVAAQALLEEIGEGAQSDSTPATIPDGPVAVEPVGKWPRYGVPELRPRVGPSNSPAQ